jgi:hypothetical protein
MYDNYDEQNNHINEINNHQPHFSTNNSNGEKTYKVLINLQPAYVKENAKGGHSGVIYDAWKAVKETMVGYKFEETFYKAKNNSEFIDKINNDNFDLGVGCIGSDYERVKKASLTRPVFMNRCVIMYKDKNLYVKEVIKFFFMYFIPFFIGIIMVAIILGFIMAKTTHQKMSTTRVVALTAASFFGSKGELFRSLTINIYSVSIILVILIVSTFSLQLLQAIITNILAQAYNDSEITHEKVASSTLIGVKGSNVPELIKTNYDCSMNFFDGNLEQCIDHYLKNTDKLDGIVANSTEALYYSKKYRLKITNKYFTLNEHGWVVNFKTPELLQPLNESIRKILDTNKMYQLCSAYLGSSEAYMCVF